MRNPAPIRWPASCLLSICLSVAAASPQAPAAPGNASNAAAFLIQAAQRYGLNGPGIKPWHLKLAFQLLDAKGKTTGQGTYEELWVTPLKFKRTYSSAAFTQTEYGTEKGTLFTGNPNAPPQAWFWLRAAFASPIVSDVMLTRSLTGANPALTIQLSPAAAAGAQLQCYGLRSVKQPASWKPLASYCFDAAKQLATFTVGFPRMGDATFMSPFNFEGHLLPADVLIKQDGVPVLSAHLESIAWLSGAEEAAMLPPPDAAPLVPTRPPLNPPQKTGAQH